MKAEGYCISFDNTLKASQMDCKVSSSSHKKWEFGINKFSCGWDPNISRNPVANLIRSTFTSPNLQTTSVKPDCKSNWSNYPNSKPLTTHEYILIDGTSQIRIWSILCDKEKFSIFKFQDHHKNKYYYQIDAMRTIKSKNQLPFKRI